MLYLRLVMVTVLEQLLEYIRILRICFPCRLVLDEVQQYFILSLFGSKC